MPKLRTVTKERSMGFWIDNMSHVLLLKLPVLLETIVCLAARGLED